MNQEGVGLHISFQMEGRPFCFAIKQSPWEKGPILKVLLASSVRREAGVPPAAFIALGVPFCPKTPRCWDGCRQDLALRQSALH